MMNTGGNADTNGPKNTSISAADFPALRSFLRGYFHEDMKDEYGSAEEAAREFCEDASAAERSAVAKEWERFLDRTRGWSVEEINQALTRELGSSCLVTPEDMKLLSQRLASSKKPR